MKFPEPIYSGIACPNCGARSNISFRDSGNYWLGEAVWKCPHCKSSLTTKELQDHNEKKEAV